MAWCLDSAGNGHTERWGRSDRAASPEQKDPERLREQRREVVAQNKAWRSATTVRLEWLALFATRKTPPQGAAGWVAATRSRSPPGTRRASQTTQAANHPPAGPGKGLPPPGPTRRWTRSPGRGRRPTRRDLTRPELPRNIW